MKVDISKLSFAELLNLKDELNLYISRYENNKLGMEMYGEVDTNPDTYRENLNLLSDVTKKMGELYTEDTLMVEEGDSFMMLQYIENILLDKDITDRSDSEITSALDKLGDLVEENNPFALNIMGIIYYEGIIVERDYERAFNLFLLASTMGVTEASRNVGYCFYYGKGVIKDYEKAYLNFSKAALDDDLEAKSMLGEMYLKGRYVNEDYDLAFKIFSDNLDIFKESEEGDEFEGAPDTLLGLGECFMYGYGCEKDLENAKNFLEDSKDIYMDMENLGRHYLGEGLKEVKKLLKELKSLN